MAEQQQHQAQRHAQEQLQAEKQAEYQAHLQQLTQKQAQLQQQQLVQWQAQEQARRWVLPQAPMEQVEYSVEELARWQATWDPADDPKYLSLLQIRNKLNFMYRISIPSPSNYPAGLTCLEIISWEVGRMMELLKVQNKQAFDELHKEIGIIEKKDRRVSHVPPTTTTGPLSLELLNGLPPPLRVGQPPLRLGQPPLRVGQPGISEFIEEGLDRPRKRKRLSISEKSCYYPALRTKSARPSPGFQVYNHEHSPSPPLAPTVLPEVQDWSLESPENFSSHSGWPICGQRVYSIIPCSLPPPPLTSAPPGRTPELPPRVYGQSRKSLSHPVDEAIEFEVMRMGHCGLSGRQEPPQQSINPTLLSRPSPSQGGGPMMQGNSPGLQPQKVQITHPGPETLNSALEYSNWEGIVGDPLLQTCLSERLCISSASTSPLFLTKSTTSTTAVSIDDFFNCDQVLRPVPARPALEYDGSTLLQPVQSLHYTQSHSQIADLMQYDLYDEGVMPQWCNGDMLPSLFDRETNNRSLFQSKVEEEDWSWIYESDVDDYGEYELELGEEVYVQEIDALW